MEDNSVTLEMSKIHKHWPVNRKLHNFWDCILGQKALRLPVKMERLLVDHHEWGNATLVQQCWWTVCIHPSITEPDGKHQCHGHPHDGAKMLIVAQWNVWASLQCCSPNQMCWSFSHKVQIFWRRWIASQWSWWHLRSMQLLLSKSGNQSCSCKPAQSRPIQLWYTSAGIMSWNCLSHFPSPLFISFRVVTWKWCNLSCDCSSKCDGIKWSVNKSVTWLWFTFDNVTTMVSFPCLLILVHRSEHINLFGEARCPCCSTVWPNQNSQMMCHTHFVGILEAFVAAAAELLMQTGFGCSTGLQLNQQSSQFHQSNNFNLTSHKLNAHCLAKLGAKL